jgi:hypothetical protein
MPDNTITDPTGGAPNFNIEDVFKSFGYTPSQAEIDALAPAFEGRTNVYQTGASAVAEYVQAHQALGAAQSLIQGNLLDEQTAAKNADTLGGVLEQGGQAAYQAAADVYTKAPQLFGALTADQITAYLKPAQDAFNKAQGATEGAQAARGLSGSSVEAQALDQNLVQFMSQTLSTGLGIGMTQQQNQASALQAKGGAMMSAGEQQFGLGVQDRSLATTSAGQNYGASRDIAGLAGSAVNQSIAQQAAIKALNPQEQSFGGKLASGFENIATQDILNLGQNLIGSIPGLGPMTQPGYGAASNPTNELGSQNPLNMVMSLLRSPTGATAGAGAGGAGAIDFTGGLGAGGGAAALA